MRTTQSLVALAAVAASALTGLGIASPVDAAPAGRPSTATTSTTSTTTHEFGYVIECTGRIHGRRAWTSLYENNTAANVIQVNIGGDRNPLGNSREVADGFVHARQVFGSVRVGGDRAVVEGHASRLRHRTQVHEEYTDAGQEIVVDGYHRRLAKDLTLTWRHRTVPLTCDNAFFYDLQVTRTDLTG